MKDTMNEIESIASKHLGKAGDGSVVKPYVTPDSVDPTLLVGVPRILNRTQYQIESGGPATLGVDVWNAYEVSFLLQNGYPVNCIVRLVYDADSVNIVESKSIKLYLNSFNMNKFETLNVTEALRQVKSKISLDLTDVLGVVPQVGVMLAHQHYPEARVPPFPSLENIVNHEEMVFEDVNENPKLLKKTSMPGLVVKTALLRSNCRVTNQPDWGDVYISMTGKNTPSAASLAQYIVSMRKENHFHEEICECIYKRLHDIFKPDNLFVACLYTRRGGIDINPIRYSSKDYFDAAFPGFTSTETLYKTSRQ